MLERGGLELEPDRYSDELKRYVLRSFNDSIPLTIRDAYAKNPKFPLTTFMKEVSRNVSEGYLEGRGDGFVVHYGLTSKGRSALVPET